MELTSERLGRLSGIGTGLNVRHVHAQRAVSAIGFETDPRRHRPAVEEWQDIVSVVPFVRGRVNLDAVAEMEEPLGAVPLPYEQVEGREEGRSIDPARQARLRMEIGAGPPTLDGHGLQPARFDDFWEGGFERSDRQPEVVAEIRLGSDAERPSGHIDQTLDRLLLARCWPGEDVRRNDPFREI